MGKSQDLYEKGLAALEQGTLQVRDEVPRWVQEVSSRQIVVAVTGTLPDYVLEVMDELVHVYHAGFHYPAHCTVAILEGASEGQEDLLVAQIQALQLEPGNLVFPNFLLTPTGELLLTNDEVPEWMSRARQMIKDCLRDLPEGVVLKIPDWIHSTAGRLTSKESNPDRLKGLVEDLAGTNSLFPVEIEPEHLFVGNGLELLSAGAKWKPE